MIHNEQVNPISIMIAMPLTKQNLCGVIGDKKCRTQEKFLETMQERVTQIYVWVEKAQLTADQRSFTKDDRVHQGVLLKTSYNDREDYVEDQVSLVKKNEPA